MYIRIGGDMAVRAETIVGVFDLDNASWSHRTRAFLQRAEKEGCVISVTVERAASVSSSSAPSFSICSVRAESFCTRCFS